MGVNRMYLNFKLVFCIVAMPCQAVDQDHFLAKKKKQTLSVDVQDVESAPVEASQDHESSASGWLQIFSAAGLSRVFNLLDADEVLEPDRFDHGLNDNAAVGTREEYPWLAEERERKRLKSLQQHQHQQHQVAAAPSHTQQRTKHAVGAAASASRIDANLHCMQHFMDTEEQKYDEHDEKSRCELDPKCSWDSQIGACVPPLRCDLIRFSDKCTDETSHPGFKCVLVPPENDQPWHCMDLKTSQTRRATITLNHAHQAIQDGETADAEHCDRHGPWDGGEMDPCASDKICFRNGDACVAKSSVTTCEQILADVTCNSLRGMHLDYFSEKLNCWWNAELGRCSDIKDALGDGITSASSNGITAL